MKTDVIVVGAGPVGLMLAGELRLAGVNVIVTERRTEPSGESRGVGFTRRAAEVFDQRGLLTRLGEVEIGREMHFGGVRIDAGLLDDIHFGVRGVPQHRIEEVLEAWAKDLGAVVQRGSELVDLRETGDAVVATVDSPDGLHDVSGAYRSAATAPGARSADWSASTSPDTRRRGAPMWPTSPAVASAPGRSASGCPAAW